MDDEVLFVCYTPPVVARALNMLLCRWQRGLCHGDHRRMLGRRAVNHVCRSGRLDGGHLERRPMQNMCAARNDEKNQLESLIGDDLHAELRPWLRYHRIDAMTKRTCCRIRACCWIDFVRVASLKFGSPNGSGPSSPSRSLSYLFFLLLVFV